MRFARTCVTLAARPFSLEITVERWNVLEQFIKFVLIGCSNACITLIVYYLFLLIDRRLYLLGNTLGYAAGILNSYFWNSRFVFTEKKAGKKGAFLRMTACYLLTYFLQTGLLYLFVEKLRLSEMVAPVLTILIATPVNFILNKLWAFQEKPHTAPKKKRGSVEKDVEKE